APVSKSGPGYSGAPRIQRQEQVIHHSPKKSSQPEGPYSSSNTLSSTASSGGHSDTDKWSDLGGPGAPGEAPDSEPNGLGGGYLQGASADSGIDTSSYGGGGGHSHTHHGSSSSLLAPGGREGRDRAASPWHSPTEGDRRVLERSPPAAESPQPPGERGERAEGTARSHSGHSSPREESSSSATSPCSQTSVSPGPKTFYPRQGATSKYLIGWRKPGSTINSVDFGDNRNGGEGGGGGGGGQGGVGGQSRPHHSPQPHLTHAKTTAEDEMKRLSPDSPLKHRRHKVKDKSSSSGQPPTRRSLHRTLSDESIYRGQRVPSLRLGDLEPDPALASDVLFSCSTLPRSPTTRGVPLRRPSYKLGIKLHGDLSASDTSLAEMVERQRQPLPQELMPLPPSESRDSPLDWTHMGPAGLERKLTKLEAMVRMLQDDLKKRKRRDGAREREERKKKRGEIEREERENAAEREEQNEEEGRERQRRRGEREGRESKAGARERRKEREERRVEEESVRGESGADWNGPKARPRAREHKEREEQEEERGESERVEESAASKEGRSEREKERKRKSR
ncbi:unnamed protein product, partial [Coregonus sp. 'balchen']